MARSMIVSDADAGGGYAGASWSANRWAILVLVAVGSMIAFIDRTSISSAIASKTFIHHFNLSNVERGWINSAFFYRAPINTIIVQIDSPPRSTRPC